MAATMMTIRDLSGFPLRAPTEGNLQIWRITPGSEGLYFDFNFNPLLDLTSPASAFWFFFDRLAEVDCRVDEEIIGRIATFAFDQVRRRNWICGLCLSVVLETVPMSIRPFDFDFDFMRMMDHRNESENGMSELEIFSLYTEEVTNTRDEEGECCSICMEGFMRGTMVIPLLPCSHRFHNACIIPWLRNNRTCPICRCICTVKFS